MSSEENELQITIPDDKDSEVIHEILEIVGRQGLTAYGARKLLEKVLRATELIPFKWDTKRRIPSTV